MNSQQIDDAMRNKIPVTYNSKSYARILEYVSWYDKQGNRKLSVVLLPEKGNFTVRVPANKIELVKDEMEEK